MKTLQNPVTSVSADGKTVTITASIGEATFSPFLTQRVTISHVNPANRKHVRHVQISGEGIFVKTRGVAFALSVDDMVAIAAAIEPKTSFAPVALDPDGPTLSGAFVSELPATVQWQVCDEVQPKSDKPGVAAPAPVWTNIAGQTTMNLDNSTVKVGQWIRYVVTNANGSTASKPVQVK